MGAQISKSSLFIYDDLESYEHFAAVTTVPCAPGLEMLPIAVRKILLDNDEDHNWHDLAMEVGLNEKSLSDAWNQPASAMICYDMIRIERRMHSKTQPLMLQLKNSRRNLAARRLILKPEDIGREACAMEIFSKFNQIWSEANVNIQGHPVQVKTYRIFLVEPESSFVEVVENSTTLGKLKRENSEQDPQSTRVRRFLDLENEAGRLQKLAATTAGFLACSYLFGIGDGHGDNLMLTKEGELFRIDFGFLFGEKPSVDAPTVWLPKTVCEALGEHMAEVLRAAEAAVQTLLARPRDELHAICKTSVFDLAFNDGEQARAYVASLSVEDFQTNVREVQSFAVGKALKSFFHRIGYNNNGSRFEYTCSNLKSPAALLYIVSGQAASCGFPAFCRRLEEEKKRFDVAHLESDLDHIIWSRRRCAAAVKAALTATDFIGAAQGARPRGAWATGLQ